MEKFEFLKYSETVFLLDKLALQQNGITKSVLRKVRYMENTWNYRPMILFTGYSPDLWFIKAILETDFADSPASMNAGTRIVGLFEYLCDAYPHRPGIQTLSYPRQSPAPGMVYEEVEKDIYKGFLNGKHVKTEYFTTYSGSIRSVERFNEDGIKEETILFDDTGNLICMTFWDLQNPGFHPNEYYFTPEKKVRIMAQYRFVANPTDILDPIRAGAGDQNELVQYTLFDANERPVKVFKTHQELIAYGLNKLAAEMGKVLLAVDESCAYSGGAALATSRNVASGTVLHNAFLLNPYDMASEVGPFYRDVCEYTKEFDGIVFLTNREKEDFAKRFGYSRKYHVIPHAYSNALSAVPFEKRNGRKVVVVSRFDNIKRIELAVAIFKLVAEQVDDVILEIYGGGGGANDTTSAIHERIKEYGLTERVFVKDYAANVAEVFSGAALSMMTSIVEGFGLTLMESICNGCPAFAFDIKYGPSDIIKDGVTGYLFREGDAVKYAAQMVEFLQDENLRRSMSAYCYQSASEFSTKVFLDRWGAYLETLYKECLERR